MRRRRARDLVSLAAAIVAATLCSCDSESSSDGGEGGTPIKTRDMYMSAEIEATDDATAKISVRLHNGDPFLGTSYSLTGGDTLNACVGTACRQLTRRLLSFDYEADLPYVAESPYTISFSRRVDVSAPDSVVTLPVAFAILSPSSGLHVTDGDVVAVQWSPATAADHDYVSGRARCDYEDGVQNTRTTAGPLSVNAAGGFATVAIDTILAARPFSPLTEARLLRCDVVIEVAQKRIGTVDSRFGGAGAALLGGGRLIGPVTRSLTLDYTPSRP